MKKILVIYADYTPLIDALILFLKDVEVVSMKSLPDSLEDFDLIVGVDNFNQEISEKVNMLVAHKSLLPPFEAEDPVKDTMLSGAKVTGITVLYTKTKQIVAQYPIFIDNNWHYDDLALELQYLEQSLFPIIVEKILANEIIEMKNILKPTNSCSGCSNGGGNSSCSNGCASGCSKCSNKGEV